LLLADDTNIDKAVAQIRKGLPILIPTETILGIAADPKQRKAVEQIFAIKRRAKNKLIPLLAPDIQSVALAANIDSSARYFIDRFWPGDITLVMEASDFTKENFYLGDVSGDVPAGSADALGVASSNASGAQGKSDASGAQSKSKQGKSAQAKSAQGRGEQGKCDVLGDASGEQGKSAQIKTIESVAIRIPSHPVSLKLLERTGILAVTSANISGENPHKSLPSAIIKTFKPNPASKNYLEKNGLKFEVLRRGNFDFSNATQTNH
jgi:tRNA A37 threonylcarbamoyladenosine synthetase subunit TsaC/SUA5/YrdC